MVEVTRNLLSDVNAVKSVTEASTIGLGPGEWPSHLAVLYSDRKVIYSRYQRELAHPGSCETASMIYRGEDGKLLVVLND